MHPAISRGKTLRKECPMRLWITETLAAIGFIALLIVVFVASFA